MERFALVLCALIVGHFLADYPLQGDFLAKAKNRTAPIAGVPWWQAMTAHAAIHGGMVCAVALWLGGIPIWAAIMFGLGEAYLHFGIDDDKCTGRLKFDGDQFLHMLCKLMFAGLIMLAGLL